MTAPVLVVLAHPALQQSKANAVLAQALADLDGVRVHDLYETYPDFLIDVEREQYLIAAAKALVFQHPFYWYSTPGLLKEWFDLVLTYGFAYGAEGRALRGKPWLSAVTAGGPAEAYDRGGYNQFTMTELMRPLEATAALCGCDWRAPFVVHGGRLMTPAQLQARAQDYRRQVEALAREAPP